jgi:protein O-mannosyl-transferase
MPDMKSTLTDQTFRPAEARERQCLWFILVITAITYLGTLRFEFVYDDGPQIVSNPFLKAWRYVPQYFVSDVWKQVFPMSPSNYYRPLFVVMMRVIYSLFANRPLGWHLVAVVLHLAVTWLTYILVRKISGQFTLAWLTALIFGLHPIHHEVVAWVSATTESLCAVFFVGAFLAYLQSLEKSRTAWMAVSCTLYLLALLSKETAIVLPALVFAYEFLGSKPSEQSKGQKLLLRIRRAAATSSFYIPIVLAYLTVRNQILRGLGHSNARVPVWMWMRTLPSIVFNYVAHWFYPVHLGEFYDVFYQPKINFTHVALPAVILTAMGAAVWIFRKRLDEKMTGIAAAWIVIPLLPALDTFVFSPQELVHDRYFYIPSIGAAFLTALVITRPVKSRIGPFGLPLNVAATGLALAAALALLTVRAASFWADEHTLFSRAYQIAPLNAKAEINLGSDLLDLGKVDAAQNVLEDGFRQHEEDPGIAAYLGRVQYAKKQYAQAEFYTRRAIALDPTMPVGHLYLGQILLKENRPVNAEQSMHRAVELNPYSAPFHISYGIALQVNGNCAGANQQFEAALALEPDEAIAKRLETVRCRTGVSPDQAPATQTGRL